MEETSIKNIPDWQAFYEEGLQYLKTVLNGSNKPDIFTPVIIYNILAMSIEKFFMGFLFFHKKLPENHTLSDMLSEVSKIDHISNKLNKKLLYMDSFQNICSLDKSDIKIPGEKDIRSFISTAIEVKIFTEKRLLL